MRIRAAEPGDRAELEGFLERWHSLRVARLGRLEHPLDHAMLVAERDGRLIVDFGHVRHDNPLDAWLRRGVTNSRHDPQPPPALPRQDRKRQAGDITGPRSEEIPA